MALPKNLNSHERLIRVGFAAGCFVVALTILKEPIAQGVFVTIGVLSLAAAASGYGPLYRYVSRLRGPDRHDEPSDPLPFRRE